MDAPNRTRKTVPLSGTVTNVRASLDYTSSLALAYLQAWLVNEGSPKVTASAVIRHALLRLAADLPNRDAAGVVRAVRRVSATHTPHWMDRKAADTRLQGHQKGQPMPPFDEVLHGPESAAKWAASVDRVDTLVAEMMRERTQHMRKRSTTREDEQ